MMRESINAITLSPETNSEADEINDRDDRSLTDGVEDGSHSQILSVVFREV